MREDAANAAMKPICSFDGCDKPHMARGLCNGHWQQQHKGQELRPLQPKITLEQRFWAKVDKTDECWLWTAATTSDGYGLIWADGRMRLAHRVSWELANESIPDSMHIDHRCGNRACVNIEHLRVVTNAQNAQHRTGANKGSASGVRGVTWDKRRDKWEARATLNDRLYHGGYYPTIDAADQAARALRKKLHTHDDHEKWLKNYQEKTK